MLQNLGFKILENIKDEDNTENNINEKWENIKTIIKETKKQLVEEGKHIETLKKDDTMRNAKLQ